MDLGSLTIFLEKVIVDAVKMSLLFTSCPVVVLVSVLDFLTNGVLAARKKV